MSKYLILNALIYNVFLFLLIAFGVWHLKSLWPFAALILVKGITNIESE